MTRPLILGIILVSLLVSPVFAQSPLATKEKPVIHFGVIPRYNPTIMYRSYQPMMDYLTANTPYRFELKLSRNYHEAVEFLQNGTTPVASLGDVTFEEAHQKFGAEPILRPLNANREAFYHSLANHHHRYGN